MSIPFDAMEGNAQFRCETCGRRYRWKAALAGRKVKCGCGAEMVYPVVAPADGDELYDFAETQPARSATVAQSAVAEKPQAAAPATLQYENPRTAAAEATDAYFPDKTLDFHLPLVLVIGGTLIHMVATLITARGSSQGVMRELAELGFQVIVGMAMTLAAVLIAVRFRGIELGNFWTALLKLAAVWLAPGAIVAVVAPLLWFVPGGGLVVWLGQFILYFALLGTLFKLDESDTWYCVCVIFIINVALHLGLLYLAA